MGSIGAFLQLLKAIVEFVPAIVGILYQAYRAYRQWKDRHPDAPKPIKTFVQAKVLNQQSTPIVGVPSTHADIPSPLDSLELILDQSGLPPNTTLPTGPAPTKSGAPLTMPAEQYDADIQRMQEIARGE